MGFGVQTHPAAAERPSRASSAEVASTHYETGLALFSLKRFDEAVSEFRKAYEVEARTDFLLHIGRSYEQLRQTDKALYFFKRFLQKAPAADPFRNEVEDFVKRNDREPTNVSPGELLPKDADTLTTPLASRQPEQPVWHTWWFWTVVGAATLLVAGTSYVLIRDGQEDRPSSMLGHMRFD